MDNSVYICYTNQDKYNQILNNLNTANVDQFKHTLFILNENGLPATNSASIDMYLGNQHITDVVNLNNISGITIEEDSITHHLIVLRNDTTDIFINNKNKLYIYGNYQPATSKSFFNIYYYNESSNEYIPIVANSTSTTKVNYVNNESKISDPTQWTSKKLVYYLQYESPIPVISGFKIKLLSETDDSALAGTTLQLTGRNINSQTISFSDSNIVDANDNEILNDFSTSPESYALCWITGTEDLSLLLDSGIYTLQALTNTSGYSLNNVDFAIPNSSTELEIKSIQQIGDLAIEFRSYATTDYLSGVKCVLSGRNDNNNIILFNNSVIKEVNDNTDISINGSQITWTSGTTPLILNAPRGTYGIVITEVPQGYSLPSTPLTDIAHVPYINRTIVYINSI